MEIAKSHKSILIIAITWIVLYVAAVYSVRLSLIYADNRYWATPLWFLLYLAPGYMAGYFFRGAWVLAGIIVGLIGTTLWLLHAQLPLLNLHAGTNALFNSILCVCGAWLGQRKVVA